MFSEPRLTGVAGVEMFFRFLQKVRFPARVAEFLKLDTREEERAEYKTSNLITMLVVMRLLGAIRLEQILRFANDPLILHRLGFSRLPDPTTALRFFGLFRRRHVEMLSRLNGYMVKRDLERQGIRKVTISIDSTPITVYGKQERAEKGYNPNAKGKRSYHPLLATLSTGHILYGCLRPGNTYSSTHAVEFLRQALSYLPASVKQITFRADSGFFSEDILRFLEARGIRYLIAAKWYGVLQEARAGLDRYHVDRKASLGYRFQKLKLKKWKRERRFMFLRLERKSHHSEDLLFNSPAYVYEVFVTNFSENLSAATLFRFYRKRAVIEKEIEEIKNDFGLKAILGRKFLPNEASFQLGILSYNLTLQFDQEILPRPPRSERRTLPTLRWFYFMEPARVIQAGRTTVLRLRRSSNLEQLWKIQERNIVRLAA